MKPQDEENGRKSVKFTGGSESLLEIIKALVLGEKSRKNGKEIYL